MKVGVYSRAMRRVAFCGSYCARVGGRGHRASVGHRRRAR